MQWFAEKRRGEEQDHDQAGFVDRRDIRSLSFLEGLKIEDPDKPVAMPERDRKIKALFDIAERLLASPLANTIPHATARITIVRIAVARSEFTFSTPILAKIVVNAAKKAASSA